MRTQWPEHSRSYHWALRFVVGACLAACITGCKPVGTLPADRSSTTLHSGRGLLTRAAARRNLREHVDPATREWVREATRRQLDGCRLRGHDGTILFTPDGTNSYHALWVRDFEYMVEYAGDLLDPQEVKAAIRFLLKGQRADGCMPDRVNADGKPVYSPGPDNSPIADHALDNGPFMVKLMAAYCRRWDDAVFFREHADALRRGLDFVSRAEDGLVFNDPARPQCGYGFTDSIAKTGRLLFESLLYFDASRELSALLHAAGLPGEEEYGARAAMIRRNIGLLWDERAGMFVAAEQDCRQIDVWGSALAVHLEVTTEEQRHRILDYLTVNAPRIFKRGQVRHLPEPEAWQRLFIAFPVGTYQNGAYWATPHAWLLPELARRNPDLASRLLAETIEDFRKNGVQECINDNYHNVSEYVVSATNVYVLLRDEGEPAR